MANKFDHVPRERSRRSERLADLIRQVLGELLEREVKDPRIGFTTLTEVQLTGDLRQARAYVSILGDEEARRQSMEGLAAAKTFLRHQLAHRLQLRHTPEIEFQLDRSQEYNERLDELIRRTKTGKH
jgi:ribosome-binding factor A